MRVVFIWFILSMGLLTTTKAQITTFNALPVGEGRGILQVQYQFYRIARDLTDANREMLVNAIPIVGVYGFSSRLSVFGMFPILNKSLTMNAAPSQRITRSSGTGLGDVTFFARYDFFRTSELTRILSISAIGGLKVPAGKNDINDSFGKLPEMLQRGSDSWDPLVGLVLTRQTLKWLFNASATYQHNTKANGFQFGDVSRIDGVFKYRLFPQKIQGGIPDYFYIDLESNLIIERKNKDNGIFDDNSGGTTWFVDPGLQFVTQEFIIEGAIQLPVVQNLNGNAVQNNFITTFGVMLNF